MTSHSCKLPTWAYLNLMLLVKRLLSQGTSGLPANLRRPDACPACHGALTSSTEDDEEKLSCACGYVHAVLQPGAQVTMGHAVGLGVALMFLTIWPKRVSAPAAAPSPVVPEASAASPEVKSSSFKIDGKTVSLTIDTSLRARDRIIGALQQVGNVGLTTEEMRTAGVLTHREPSTRVTEAVTANKVKDSGRRRGGTVWVLA